MKVGIIGSGMVGATSAYAIMMRKAASDIVLFPGYDLKRMKVIINCVSLK